MTYVLKLRFCGTAYCGWQVQRNGRSVQSAVQDAAEAVFGARLPVTGCSRTDAGVQANGFICTIGGAPPFPAERLPFALNRALPADIAVCAARAAEEGFHPRYCAVGKEYVYQIWNSRARNPFLAQTAWHYPFPLDAAAADLAARQLCGRQDFRSFMAAGSKITDTVRTVASAAVMREGELLRFTVTADGFLYHMVRIMAGTVCLLASGKAARPIPEIIAARDRAAAGPTAPAKGLFLNRVFYPSAAYNF